MTAHKCTGCSATFRITGEGSECPYCGTYNSLNEAIAPQQKPAPQDGGKKKSRKPLLILALVFVLLVAVGGVLYFTLSSTVSQAPVSHDMVQAEVNVLNFRDNPDTRANVIYTASINEKFEYLGCSSHSHTVDNIRSRWINIRLPNGFQVWAFGGYLKILTRNTDLTPPISLYRIYGTEWREDMNMSLGRRRICSQTELEILKSGTFILKYSNLDSSSKLRYGKLFGRCSSYEFIGTWSYDNFENVLQLNFTDNVKEANRLLSFTGNPLITKIMKKQSSKGWDYLNIGGMIRLKRYAGGKD
jgi:hypothetical protein